MSGNICPNIAIAQYTIVSKIGEGGMGEVWRARDNQLGRDVAIKVLPAALSADKDRLARFEQEAQAAGALNHPNILVIHHIGIHDGAPYIVSELLEGETLRERMSGSALPQRKAIDCALQIARGLAAAHEKGIVHRDIKPDNLFVTNDGRIKILDFGIAKLTGSSDGTQSQTEVPTRKVNTDPGTVMGTVGYMSPEQLKGQPTDHRTDIFSFGAILYEMLSGKRAFRGDSMAETMSAILREDPPDLSETNKTISPALERVVHHCLEKNPAERFHSARDLAFALESLSGSTPSSAEAVTMLTLAPRWIKRRERLPWIVTAALGLAVAGFVAWRILTPTPVQPPFLTLDVAAPPGWRMGQSSALSPDGLWLAFTARRPQEKSHLWIRHLATGESRLIADSEDAVEPFWSPDGAEVAFFTSDRLRAVNITTGRSRVICDVTGGRRAGTWNAKGLIVFSTEVGVPLKKVPADGKSPPADLTHGGFRPFFLPDGRHFLFGRGISVGDIETGEVREISANGVEPKYAAGFLFFALDGQLRAQAFDAESFKLSGEPMALADIGQHRGTTGKNYSVAASGLVAFRAGDALEAARELVWYKRDGTRTVVGQPDSWTDPALSPDDSLVALESGRGGDIWMFDVGRGTARMFASGRPNGAVSPIWSADGRSILYSKLEVGLFEKRIEGGSERVIEAAQAHDPKIPSMFPRTQFTADGSTIGFRLDSGNRDIVIRTR